MTSQVLRGILCYHHAFLAGSTRRYFYIAKLFDLRSVEEGLRDDSISAYAEMTDVIESRMILRCPPVALLGL